MTRFNALQGLNTATRFSTETEAASIARYNLISHVTRDGEDALRAASAHFGHRYRTLFANTDFWSYRQFTRNLVMKYGPGPLLEGAKLTAEGFNSLGAPRHLQRVHTHGIRYRRQARATGLLDAIDEGIKRDLREGRTLRMLHGIFPKAFVDYVHKLDANPTKMRTITPMFMRDHMLQARFSGSLNRRAVGMWRELPFALGMPMTGTGFNAKYERANRHSRHVEFDFTTADAMFPGKLLQEIANLRALGFADHAHGAQLSTMTEN